MKKGYKAKIEKLTQENENFRQVLYTGGHSQLVLMSLRAGEDIGLETHKENDQFFRFESGSGKVLINEMTYKVTDGDAVIVPAGAKHNIINTGKQGLKFYTIYSPAHHKDGIVHATRKEALEDDEEFDGKTTEN